MVGDPCILHNDCGALLRILAWHDPVIFRKRQFNLHNTTTTASSWFIIWCIAHKLRLSSYGVVNSLYHHFNCTLFLGLSQISQVVDAFLHLKFFWVEFNVYLLFVFWVANFLSRGWYIITSWKRAFFPFWFTIRK